MQITFHESPNHISRLRLVTKLSRFNMKKIKFSLQSVNIVTVIISLYFNETIFAYIALAKNCWKIKLREFKSDQKHFAK